MGIFRKRCMMKTWLLVTADDWYKVGTIAFNDNSNVSRLFAYKLIAHETLTILSINIYSYKVFLSFGTPVQRYSNHYRKHHRKSKPRPTETVLAFLTRHLAYSVAFLPVRTFLVNNIIYKRRVDVDVHNYWYRETTSQVSVHDDLLHNSFLASFRVLTSAISRGRFCCISSSGSRMIN